MRNQNSSRKSKKYCKYRTDKLHISTNVRMRETKKSKRKWQLVYNTRRKSYRLIVNRVAMDGYVFYSVLNTDIAMELDVAASIITRCILGLHNQLLADASKNPFIELWNKSGQDILILKGYNHRHLKYLEEEAKFVALGTHTIYHRWQHSRMVLALSVFGQKQNIEDIFYGLPYLWCRDLKTTSTVERGIK